MDRDGSARNFATIFTKFEAILIVSDVLVLIIYISPKFLLKDYLFHFTVLQIDNLPINSRFWLVAYVKRHFFVIFYMNCAKIYHIIVIWIFHFIWHLNDGPWTIEPSNQLYALSLPIFEHNLQNSILSYFLLHWPFITVLRISRQLYCNFNISFVCQGKFLLNWVFVQ